MYLCVNATGSVCLFVCVCVLPCSIMSRAPPAGEASDDNEDTAVRKTLSTRASEAGSCFIR